MLNEKYYVEVAMKIYSIGIIAYEKKNGIYDLQSGSSINDSACICGRLGS